MKKNKVSAEMQSRMGIPTANARDIDRLAEICTS